MILDGPLLHYAGPQDQAPRTPQAQVHRVPAVMPGLWDCHAHFMGLTAPNLADIATTPPQVAAMRVARDASVALDAGFTSVREVGGLGVWVAPAVAEGSVSGPTVYAAGAVLSPTGGHADLHMYPPGWVCDLADRVGMLRQCDGIPECLRAVRLQLRNGARLIKVCASGGVMSQIDHPVHQQFSDDELRAIVEEAARAERVVAAHCHGKPGIMAALRAGARTIEHGTYLDEEAADAMRECDAVLVPTRLIIEEYLAHGAAAGLPDYAHRKLIEVADRHAAAIAIAHERGVRIALGTDIGGIRHHHAVPLGAERRGTRPAGQGGPVTAGRHRGRHGDGPAHPGPAGAPVRPARSRLRRRRDRPHRRPGRRPLDRGGPGEHHPRLEGRRPGQGTGRAALTRRVPAAAVAAPHRPQRGPVSRPSAA